VISSHIDNNRHNAEGITWYGGGIMRIYMSPHPDPMVLDSRKGIQCNIRNLTYVPRLRQQIDIEVDTEYREGLKERG
jgi:hypothetical protein